MAKRKLKKSVKIIGVVGVLLIVSIIVGINAVKTINYHKTYEYKLLNVGYSLDEIKVLTNKLESKELDKLLETEKSSYIISILSEKYYLSKNYEAYIDFYKKNTDKSFSDIVALVNVGATKKWYEDAKVTDVSKGYAMLVNKFNLLPENYEAGTIKKFSSTYAYGNGTIGAEESVYNAFISMCKAAKEAGYTLIANDGYRTRESQEKTYNSILKTRGTEYADEYAAHPGASEHETGYAIDFVEYKGKGEFDESEAFNWVQEHAKEYGFILRYPKDKEYITGYKYESWHYRYVGVELAQKVKEEGITFDEYYAYYLDK